MTTLGAPKQRDQGSEIAKSMVIQKTLNQAGVSIDFITGYESFREALSRSNWSCRAVASAFYPPRFYHDTLRAQSANTTARYAGPQIITFFVALLMPVVEPLCFPGW